MTGPQLPSPEHATTLDADLRELIEAVRDHRFEQEMSLDGAGIRKAYARVTAAESRLRSRITALEMENERLRSLSQPAPAR